MLVFISTAVEFVFHPNARFNLLPTVLAGRDFISYNKGIISFGLLPEGERYKRNTARPWLIQEILTFE